MARFKSNNYWAICLLYWALQEIQRTGSRAPFVAMFNGVPCIIIPALQPESIVVTAFYGAKRALNATVLAAVGNAPPFRLIDGWPKYCRAVVFGEMSPAVSHHPTAIIYSATRNARSELSGVETVMPPSLASLDAALGTSLEYAQTFARDEADLIFERGASCSL